MSLLKKYKELPEETKAPIEVVAACETAGVAVMSLAFLIEMGSAISGFACGIVFTASTLATAVLGHRVCKSVNKTLAEQKAENAQAEEAYKA